MAERAYQQPEPAKVIRLFPETPTPIWSHPSFQHQEPTPWQVPKDFEGIMAFNPRHYIQAYLDLRTIRNRISTEEYRQRLEQQNTLTYHDLQKTVLERLIATQSTIKYHIENGKLINDDFGEPALERYERGQKFLEENGSNEVEREKAEVAGMYKVEELLANGHTTVIVASARSEGCKHTSEEENPKGEPEDILYHQQHINVFQQKNGVITMTQLHSTHSIEALLSALQEVDPQYPQTEIDTSLATLMLLNPAIPIKSFEQIKDKFAIDIKNTTPSEDCAEVIAICTPIFLSFIETLINDPLDIIQIKKTVNTMYNLADETEEKIKRRKLQQAKILKVTQGRSLRNPRLILNVPSVKDQPFVLDYNIQAAMFASQLIDKYGSQQAKTVGGACPGKQKGFKISLGGTLQQLAKTLGAKSVVDFAKMLDDDEDEDTSDFACGGTKPDGSPCTYIVKYGSGKTECPECHRKAVCG